MIPRRSPNLPVRPRRRPRTDAGCCGLGALARRIAADWQAVHGHPVYYLETFVDPERFAGTCYRAANWQVLGLTTGRGKDAVSRQPNRSLKQVLGLPLHPDFRRRLGVA